MGLGLGVGLGLGLGVGLGVRLDEGAALEETLLELGVMVDIRGVEEEVSVSEEDDTTGTEDTVGVVNGGPGTSTPVATEKHTHQ